MVPYVLPIILTPDDAQAAAIKQAFKPVRQQIEDLWLNWGFPIAVAEDSHRGTWESRANYSLDGNLCIHKLGRECSRQNGQVWRPEVDVFLFLWRGMKDFAGLGAQDGGENRGYGILGDADLDFLLTGVRAPELQVGGMDEWLIAGPASHEIWHALGSPGRNPADGLWHTTGAPPNIGFNWWLAPNVTLVERPSIGTLRAMEALR